MLWEIDLASESLINVWEQKYNVKVTSEGKKGLNESPNLKINKKSLEISKRRVH